MMRKNALKSYVSIIICVILAVVLAICFASCNNEPNKDEETSATTQIGGEDTTNPGGEDTTPGGEDTTPGGEDTTPGGEDTTNPSGEDTTPGGEDTTTPGGEDTTLGGEDTTPGGEDTTTPGGEDTTEEETTEPHEHLYDEGTVTTQPTCTEEGEKLYVCSVCGHEEREDIPKLEHDMGEWVQITAPTVSEEGVERKTCKNCDHFEERAIDKLPVVWYITVKDGMGGTATVGVAADGVYSLTAPTRIGYNFLGWKEDSDGNDFSASGTINSDVSVTALWELDATETLDELIERAAAGVDRIYITKDIIIDRTVYVTGQTTIYSDKAVKLIRGTDFAGDMFIIGQDKDGKHYVFENGVAELILGKPDGSSNVTIDGNRDNVTVSVNGSALCIVNSAKVSMYDGVSIVNHKKVGNEISHLFADRMGNTYTVGGAAAVIISGTFDMYGGVIANNSVNIEDIGNEADGTSFLSSYGGAIYNFGTFNMYGGELKNNEASRGGAIYTRKMVNIYAGLIEGNRATNKGGAIGTSESPYAEVYLGSHGAADDTLIFRNNIADVQGGVYLGYYRTPLMVMGGVTFEGNRAESSVGGVISTAGPVIIENAKFIGNYAYQSGGVIYQSYIGEDTTAHEIRLTNCYFDDNEAGRGGVILVTAADDLKDATNVIISGCTFKNNKAVERISETVNEATGETVVNKSYGNGGVIYATKKTTVTITDSTFDSNSAEVSAGAMYLTTDTVVTVNSTLFEGNSSVLYGGAVYAVASSKLTLNSVTFENNGGIEDGAYVTERGGAVYVGDSTVTAKKCTYDGNSASIGGAVYVAGVGSYTDGSSSDKTGADVCEFKNNLSGKGGAVCVYGTAKFYGTAFNGNASDENGGAAYAGTDGQLLFKNCLFDGNEVRLSEEAADIKSYGGAVYAINAVLNIEDSTFRNNGFVIPESATEVKTYGGAVAASGAATVSIKDSDLEYNSAQYGGAVAIYSVAGNNLTVNNVKANNNSSENCGGAMYINEANTTITGLVASGNESRSGGALYVSECGEFTIGGDSVFENNVASNGGAIFVGEQTVISDVASTFTGNTATKGGAVYINSATATDSASGESVTYRGKITLENSKFVENKANVNETDSRGGAIFAYGGVVTAQGVSFEGNTATLYGGAICADTASEIELTDTVFTDNVADGNGGALWTYFDSNTVICGIVAKGNTSTSGSGGFMYTRGNVEIKTEGDRENIFGGSGENELNSAVSGGVIYVNGPDEEGKTSVINISDAEFIGNKASESGGAFFFVKSTVEIENCSFDGNTADKYAGAIELLNSSAEITETSFINNTATNNGGAIYATQTPARSEIVTVRCNFTNNTSATNGGAVYLTGTATYRDGAEDGTGASTFKGNSAANGGAVYVYGAAAFNGTKFESNTANNGGAIGINVTNLSGSGEDAVYSEGKVILNGATFTSNKATGQGDNNGGGAIYVYAGATLEDNSSTFTSNEALKGAAIYTEAQKGTLTATLTLDGTTFEKNIATKYAAVCVYNGTVFTAEGCTFTNNENTSSNGGALFIYTTGAEISESTFTGNTAKGSGGAIYVSETPAGSAVVTTGCTFEDNKADGNGGAVYITGTGIYRDGDEGSNNGSTFKGNSAASGGAIGSYGAVMLNGSTFEDNSSTGHGGAIMVTTGSLTVDSSEFIGNSVTGSEANGGAIYVTGTYATVTNTTFDGNEADYRGGAIYATSTPTAKAVTTDGCTFKNNSAVDNGGALYLTGTATYRDGAEDGTSASTFTGNSAANGGAITTHGTLTLVGTSVTGNTATANGGGIYVGNGTATLNTASFNGNNAANGGAIYLAGGTLNSNDSDFTSNSVSNADASVEANGGAIYVCAGATLEDNSSTFTSNEALKGAAIYTEAQKGTLTATLTLDGTTFEKNIATKYAAVCVYNGTNFTAEGCTFKNNQNTTSNGGAIYVYATSALIKDCQFTGNTAKGSGGAIYVSETPAGSAVVTTGCTFEGNKADGNGGAVYITGTGIYRDGDEGSDNGSDFTSNSAVNGGAIGSYGAVTLNGSTFEDNKATTSGGAVFVAVSSSGSDGALNVDSSIFEGNSAANGGAIHITSGTLDVKNSSFTDNEATVSGGAIYAGGASVTTIKAMTAKGNEATSLGAVVYVTSASTVLNLEGAVIYDNNTAKDISCGFIHLANATAVVNIYKSNVTMLSSDDDSEVTINDWTDLLLNPKSGTINELSEESSED